MSGDKGGPVLSNGDVEMASEDEEVPMQLDAQEGPEEKRVAGGGGGGGAKRDSRDKAQEAESQDKDQDEDDEDDGAPLPHLPLPKVCRALLQNSILVSS